jgi:hypothetical protein
VVNTESREHNHHATHRLHDDRGRLFVVCCLVGLLLTDALSPGRLPPMLAFYAACGAGLSLILGLVMLERRGVPHGIAAFEGR